MDATAGWPSGPISIVEDFSLDVAADRLKTFDTLLFKGRRVTEVEARLVEAQFRLADGSMLVLLNDDTPFKEMLTIVLVGPGLTVRDRVLLGGAFTPGYLTYAYPAGPHEVAFCWHELEQVVAVGRTKRWFGLRSRWLTVREVEVRSPQPVRVDAVTLSDLLPRFRVSGPERTRTRRRHGRPIPSLMYLAWLSVRVFRLDRTFRPKLSARKPGRRGRAPRR